MLKLKYILTTFILGVLFLSNQSHARFVSVDPVGAQQHIQAGNIQGFNRYAYGNNNPYKYVDPDGRAAENAMKAAMALRQSLSSGTQRNVAIATGGAMLGGTALAGSTAVALAVSVSEVPIAISTGEAPVSINPGTLRLPPNRADGADPIKLSIQMKTHGDSATNMPAIQVTVGQKGEMMINDGVTRATRIDTFNKIDGTNKKVPIEVIDKRPNMDLSDLPKVRDQ